MRRLKPIAAILIGLVLGLAKARGQALNIDLGGTSVPTNAYGAAAAQPGLWNHDLTDFAIPLIGLDGSPTSATLTGSSSGAAAVLVPSPSADERNLMEDYQRFGYTAGGYYIQGMLPGDYDVFVYSWNGDGGPHPTILVSGGGVTTPLALASYDAWPGGQVRGKTYDIVRVSLLAGQDIIAVSGFATNESSAPINGIQIVAVPAPGSAGVAAIGTLALGRRRRRACC